MDRFHVSTIVYQRREHGRDYDFAWLDERLRPLGFRIVLCWRNPATFQRARAARLEVSGNPDQYADLPSFIAEQEAMRAVARRSRLPLLELDVSDDDVAADRIADWLEDTGGLCAPWGVDEALAH